MVQLPHHPGCGISDHHGGNENMKQHILTIKGSLNVGRFPSGMLLELLAVDLNS